MDIDKERNFNYKNNNLKQRLSIEFLIVIFFLMTFFIPLTSAIEIDMKSNFSQGETLLAVVSGNFIDQITNDNIRFYRNNVGIPMISEVVKIDNDFYIYAILTDKNSGNYSIEIEGVRYYKATQIVDDDIISNFTISGETAQFSVNPGALITEDDFSVEIQNLQDKKIIVEIISDSSINSVSSVELNTGEKKTVFFNLDSQAIRGLVNLDFSSEDTIYSMPVYLYIENIEKETVIQNFNMEFQPKVAEVSIATNSNAKRIIYLKNTGTENLEDISFNVSSLLEDYVTISSKKLDSLDSGEIKKIEFDISSGSEEEILEGKITAYTEETLAIFTLILNLTKDFIPKETEENLNIVSLCEDLGGEICPDTQECSGKIVRSKNGDCCIFPLICQQPKKNSLGKIIGWSILILVFIIIFWFFKKKYKSVKKLKPF